MSKIAQLDKRTLSKLNLDLAEKIRDGVASCYGLVRFSPGASLKAKIGAKAASLENGGVSVRLYPNRSTDVMIHALIGYKISVVSLSLNINQMVEYVIRKKGYILRHLDIYIEGVASN